LCKKIYQKPQCINAWKLNKQLLKEYMNRNVIDEFFCSPDGNLVDVPLLNVFTNQNNKYYAYMTTLEGRMECQENDWLVQGLCGEFYFIRNDIFEKTYNEK